MHREQVTGLLIFLGVIIGIVVYGWMIFLTEYAMTVLQLSAFVAVVLVLATAAWIGYAMSSATTKARRRAGEGNRERAEDRRKSQGERVTSKCRIF